MSNPEEICPVCGSTLKEPEETKSGKRLQRCSKGQWNSQTRETDGCSYVKWLDTPPKTLDEKCPECGAALVLQVTRMGKKMKKCSTGGWDKENRVATGCTYVEWIGNERKELKENCPLCDQPLVEITTAKGKKMKKCSTSGWNAEFRQPTGCTYIQWIN